MLTKDLSWACAVPTVAATILILMKDMIYAWLVRIVERKRIGSLRKKKKEKQKTIHKLKLKM